MLKYYGADRVRVLNGGFKKWLAEGKPIAEGIPQEKDPKYDENSKDDYSYFVKNSEICILQIKEMWQHAQQLYTKGKDYDVQVLDARSPGRFDGTLPEPRKGIRGGHMKNSVNVPFYRLLNLDGTFKSNKEIKKVFHKQGADITKPSISSCGSGLTACVVDLGL
jgi:thiosulfate/3-mercaptopyruvate sulfurtransferase